MATHLLVEQALRVRFPVGELVNVAFIVIPRYLFSKIKMQDLVPRIQQSAYFSNWLQNKMMFLGDAWNYRNEPFFHSIRFHHSPEGIAQRVYKYWLIGEALLGSCKLVYS